MIHAVLKARCKQTLHQVPDDGRQHLQLLLVCANTLRLCTCARVPAISTNVGLNRCHKLLSEHDTFTAGCTPWLKQLQSAYVRTQGVLQGRLGQATARPNSAPSWATPLSSSANSCQLAV